MDPKLLLNALVINDILLHTAIAELKKRHDSFSTGMLNEAELVHYMIEKTYVETKKDLTD